VSPHGTFAGDDPRSDLVRRLQAAWNRGDVDAAIAAHHTGERILLILEQRNRGEAGGVETSNRWGQLLSFRDGLIIRAENYYEVDDALEAIRAR
jgi:ketosteroid isomerase-like protein